MGQALFTPKADWAFFGDVKEEQVLQNLLDRLSLKKISWEQFKEKVDDPFSIARLTSSPNKRTLLHLAVLDNRLDMIQILKRDPSLKLRRDGFGLSSIDIAQFLNRKEVLHILQPLSEVAVFPDLPSLSQFEYLPHPVFETREGFEKVLSYVAKAKGDDKIAAEKIWLGSYFDTEIRQGSHPPISIQHIDNEVGYGVFSEAKIPTCNYVGEYTGLICQKKPKELKEKMHCLRYPIWGGKENFTIDAEKRGNFTRFINHSSQPNLGLQSVYWGGVPRMIFISLKEIRKGNQLTFDYGPLYWKHQSQIPKDLFNDL